MADFLNYMPVNTLAWTTLLVLPILLFFRPLVAVSDEVVTKLNFEARQWVIHPPSGRTFCIEENSELIREISPDGIVQSTGLDHSPSFIKIKNDFLISANANDCELNIIDLREFRTVGKIDLSSEMDSITYLLRSEVDNNFVYPCHYSVATGAWRLLKVDLEKQTVVDRMSEFPGSSKQDLFVQFLLNRDGKSFLARNNKGVLISKFDEDNFRLGTPRLDERNFRLHNFKFNGLGNHWISNKSIATSLLDASKGHARNFGCVHPVLDLGAVVDANTISFHGIASREYFGRETIKDFDSKSVLSSHFDSRNQRIFVGGKSYAMWLDAREYIQKCKEAPSDALGLKTIYSPSSSSLARRIETVYELETGETLGALFRDFKNEMDISIRPNTSSPESMEWSPNLDDVGYKDIFLDVQDLNWSTDPVVKKVTLRILPKSIGIGFSPMGHAIDPHKDLCVVWGLEIKRSGINGMHQQVVSSRIALIDTKTDQVIANRRFSPVVKDAIISRGTTLVISPGSNALYRLDERLQSLDEQFAEFRPNRFSVGTKSDPVVIGTSFVRQLDSRELKLQKLMTFSRWISTNTLRHPTEFFSDRTIKYRQFFNQLKPAEYYWGYRSFGGMLVSPFKKVFDLSQHEVSRVLKKFPVVAILSKRKAANRFDDFKRRSDFYLTLHSLETGELIWEQSLFQARKFGTAKKYDFVDLGEKLMVLADDDLKIIPLPVEKLKPLTPTPVVYPLPRVFDSVGQVIRVPFKHRHLPPEAKFTINDPSGAFKVDGKKSFVSIDTKLIWKSFIESMQIQKTRTGFVLYHKEKKKTLAEIIEQFNVSIGADIPAGQIPILVDLTITLKTDKDTYEIPHEFTLLVEQSKLAEWAVERLPKELVDKATKDLEQ